MRTSNTFFEDVRYTLRVLRRNPAFALVAVVSLALGIGANTAIFSLLDAVMLRPLPVAEPDRLVLLSDPNSAGVSIGTQTGVRSLLTYEEFEQIRDANDVFSGVFAAESNAARVNVRIAHAPVEEVRGKLVSANYFEVLGVRAVLGRTFTAAEDSAPGADPLVLLGHRYWQSRFGGDRSVVGRTIEVNRTALTIVGVLPPGFNGETVGEAPDVFVPMMMEPQLKPGRFWLRDDPQRAEKVMWLHVGGRLKDGVTMASAQANIDVVFKRYLASQAGAVADEGRKRELLDQRLQLRPGSRGASMLREEFGDPLLVLMGIVGLVLLIACANVANLLLARAMSRQKELGIRLALGAGRRRILRQLLTESLVLAAFGAVAGTFVAYWAAHLLVGLASTGPSPVPLDLRPDARVLAFTAAVAAVTGLAFGLVPAWQATRVSMQGVLKERAHGSSAGRMNLGRTLVVGQVALSLLLLTGAGLFVRTLANLKHVDLGYAPDHLLVVRVDAVSAGYEGQARADLFRRLAARLRALPGVQGVIMSENGLFSGTESGDRVTVEGYHSDAEADNASRFDQIGPGYFTSLGVPILIGRDISTADVKGSNRVCVVNEAFAKFYFGKANPIGKHVTDEFPDTRATMEIVGVARDLRDHRLRGDVPRRFYVPLLQPLGDYPPSAYYIIRAAADPAGIIMAVRRAVAEVDDALPVQRARTLPELIDRLVAQERLVAEVSGFFGVLALVLAAIGLYGVLGYSVARRTHEIGIRMALGAGQRRILSGVMRESLLVVSVGVALGLAATAACGRLVKSLLFGLAVVDPLTLAGAIAMLAAVAAFAAYVPARRASRVDPLQALRYE